MLYIILYIIYFILLCYLISHALCIFLCACQADVMAKKPKKNIGSPKLPDSTPLEGEGVAFLRVAHTPYMDLLFCF